MSRSAGAAPEMIEPMTDPTSAFLEAESLGDGLRLARAASGKSMAELAAETKVHPRFLSALEQNDWSTLPPRVFALGYVRSYAGALGLDEQSAVERFKRESPDTSTPLKPPVGIAFEDVRRHSPRVLGVAAVLVVAVIAWNVFQRISLMQAPHPSDIAATPPTWLKESSKEEGVSLGAPLPAPPDQTVPALYVTPGLEAQLTGVDPADPTAAPPVEAPPVRRAFNPRGAVYGAPANASQVVIQAAKAGALVVRTGESQVLFARQMAAGEAWRAPLGLAATLDVSDPAAFDVYLNGEYDGRLPEVLTPLARLNTRAEQLARQAAEAQARVQAQEQAQALAVAQARARAEVPASAQASAPAAATPAGG